MRTTNYNDEYIVYDDDYDDDDDDDDDDGGDDDDDRDDDEEHIWSDISASSRLCHCVCPAGKTQPTIS